MSLLAVHIADGVLSPAWLGAGMLGALLLALPGLVRVADEEIPRLALMTAVFFVASSIHLPLPPTSVHLLLNGLVGVVLGWRAGLSIFVGLLFQWTFLGHGGLWTVGINTCVLTLPALCAAGIYRVLDRWPFVRRRWGRSLLTFVSAVLVLGSAVIALELLRRGTRQTDPNEPPTWLLPMHVAALCLVLLASAAAVGAERRFEDRPGFPLGCLLGVTSVLLTVALQAVVLRFGMRNVSTGPILVIVVAHLPVAALEGIVLGSVIAFVSQVRPELLREASRATPTTSSPAQGKQLVEPNLPLTEPDTDHG